MADLQGILTDLMDYALKWSHPRRKYRKPRQLLVASAIATAADQIRAQQQQRVETLQDLYKHALGVIARQKAALAELEAEGE